MSIEIGKKYKHTCFCLFTDVLFVHPEVLFVNPEIVLVKEHDTAEYETYTHKQFTDIFSEWREPFEFKTQIDFDENAIS